MKEINNLININLLKKLKGNNFNKYKHERFIFTNTVTGIIGIMIDNKSYELTNEFKSIDYLGLDDEATFIDLKEENWDDIKSITDNEIIVQEVNEAIKDIIVVNDNYKVYDNNVLTYDYTVTRSIIFKFNEYEISFSKQDCWFSQEIEVNKGYNLINKISSGEDLLEENDLNRKIVFTRNKILI